MTTTTNTLALYMIDSLLLACKSRVDPVEWAYSHSLFPCSGLFYVPEIGYAFDKEGLDFEAKANIFDLQIPKEGLQVLYVPVEQARKVEKRLDLHGLELPDSEPVEYPALDRAIAEWAADVFTAEETIEAQQARRLDEIEEGIEDLADQPAQGPLWAVYHPAVRGAIPSDWYDLPESAQQWLLQVLLEVGETQVRIPVLWENWEAKVLEVAEGPAPGMAARSGAEWLRLFQQIPGTGTK